MTDSHAIPRPAATVILARDTEHGPEVFMMKRTTEVAFAKGMHVFPGGALDAADRHADLAARCAGLDDTLASAQLGIAQGGLAYWIAAIRECFEEAGLLLGYREQDELLALQDEEADRLAALRLDLASHKVTFAEILERENLRAATDLIAYYSHWITQPGRPRRYDTRFFVARAPRTQVPMHDNSELVAHLWVRPGDALEMARKGEMTLMFPTVKTLESLTRFARVEDLLEFARSPRARPVMAPRAAVALDGSQRTLVPGDFAYAEVKKLDPDNNGHVWSDIKPGRPVAIADQVIRVTAANPGMMTGPGTNTYLIGNAQTGIAVIDPGPLLEDHIAAIEQNAAGPIKWILCTHTHIDHSPAAAVLREKHGAAVYGMPPPPYPNQDQTFRPDHVVHHGEQLNVAGITLRVIHTPGHASNQVCYLWESDRLLFTGDHIMQGSTVVINPPDGHMTTYLNSLRLLQSENIDYLAPGHGFLIAEPAVAVDRLLVHRQTRENKVLEAMRRVGAPADLETLVVQAYDDTPANRHKVAMRSLSAHLQKLQDEGRVQERDGLWSLAA